MGNNQTQPTPSLIGTFTTGRASTLVEYLASQTAILNNPKNSLANRVDFAIQTILEAKRLAGTNPLTKEEAKLLVTFLSILFVNFTHSPISNELSDQVIFVPGDPSDEGRLMGNRESPAVNQLKIDYPNLLLNIEEEVRISLNLIDPMVLGYTYNEKIFFFINKINDYKNNPTVQAFAQNSDVSTKVIPENGFRYVFEENPFTIFTSIAIHELGHFQADKTEFAPVDPNWSNRLSKISGVDEVKKATSSGFRIHYVAGDVLMTMDGFEEFFADYLMVKVCQNFRLPYTLANTNIFLADFQLFDQVLQLSHITMDELIAYQKKGQTQELFVRITERNYPEGQLNLEEVRNFVASLFLSFNQGAWREMLSSLLTTKKS